MTDETQHKVGDIISNNREPGIRYEVTGFEQDTHDSTHDQMLIKRTDQKNALTTGIPRYRWDYWQVHTDEGSGQDTQPKATEEN